MRPQVDGRVPRARAAALRVDASTRRSTQTCYANYEKIDTNIFTGPRPRGPPRRAPTRPFPRTGARSAARSAASGSTTRPPPRRRRRRSPPRRSGWPTACSSPAPRAPCRGGGLRRLRCRATAGGGGGGVDLLQTGRGDAAAATRIARGEESRRRRGRDARSPWRRGPTDEPRRRRSASLIATPPLTSRRRRRGGSVSSGRRRRRGGRAARGGRGRRREAPVEAPVQRRVEDGVEDRRLLRVSEVDLPPAGPLLRDRRDSARRAGRTGRRRGPVVRVQKLLPARPAQRRRDGAPVRDVVARLIRVHLDGLDRLLRLLRAGLAS